MVTDTPWAPTNGPVLIRFTDTSGREQTLSIDSDVRAEAIYAVLFHRGAMEQDTDVVVTDHDDAEVDRFTATGFPEWGTLPRSLQAPEIGDAAAEAVALAIYSAEHRRIVIDAADLASAAEA